MKHIIALLAAFGLSWSLSCQHKVDLVNPDIIKSDAAGNLYVMQRYDKIVKFDGHDRVLFEIEKKSGFGRNYAYPWLFDVAADGHVYVLYYIQDRATGKTAGEQVLRYGPDGAFDRVVFRADRSGENAAQRDRLYTVLGLAADGDGLRLLLTQADGTLALARLGPDGTEAGRTAIDVYNVSGMCVSANGAVIMADMARNEVVVADSNGEVTRFGVAGTAPGNFRSPAAVCTDSRAHIYVCDAGNRRVQQFDRSGSLLAVWPRPVPAPGANDVNLRSIARGDSSLYIAEYLGNRIIVYNPQGRMVREITYLNSPQNRLPVRRAGAGLGLLLGAAALAWLLLRLMGAYRQRLAVRLIVLFAGTGVAAVCAASLLIYFISYRNYEKEVREKYLTVAQMLANTVRFDEVAATTSPDDDNYQTLLNRFQVVLGQSSNIDWIGVYLAEGERLYYGIDTDESGLYTPVFKVSPKHREVLGTGRPGYFEYTDETGRYLAAVAPVLDAAGAVRTLLEVSCDLDFLTRYRTAVLYNMLGVSLACIAVFCLISILVALTVTRPVRELTRGAQAVEQGRYDHRLHSTHRHEVGRFIATFNEMMASLAEKEKIRSIMNKVVSKEVAHELLKNKVELGGAERRASILFTDIRGFTTIAEAMEPAELVTMLNEYFSRMSPLVDKEGGVIDKYIGDAIMAIFGAPLEFPDDAIRAVRAGTAMLKELEVFNTERTARQLPAIHIGVGINSGTVVAGNIGSEDRLNYTIIGDAVNLASRLEGLTKYYGVGMIISEEVAGQIGDEYLLRQLDIVRVKGKKGSSRLFEVVIADEEKWREIVRLFGQAVQYYRAQQWDQAEALFNKVLVLGSADKPSGIYLARIAEYRLTPPSQDWDGVYVAKAK
jgi:class 3 adenylate cyclase/sugar lactone lactonase YvrE